MASGTKGTTTWPVEHKFNYANTKLTFKQEVGYYLRQNKLQYKVVQKKENIQKIINDIKQNKKDYKDHFTDKCAIVNENGKDILCLVNIHSKPNVQKRGTKRHSLIAIPYVLNIKQILCIDELFDVMFELHMLKPRLDKNGIIEHLNNCVLYNVFINLLWKSCETCRCVIKPDTFFRLGGEITVFGINPPDGNFTKIFMYAEKNTNFVLLRPLNTMSRMELAYELLTIMADFGSHSTWSSNMFHSMLKEVLHIIKSVDPPFKVPVMFGRKKVLKSTVLVMKAKKLLLEWMKNTQSSNWAIGVHIVQWMMNSNKVLDLYIRSKVVKGLIHSPYHAMFGVLPHTDNIQIKEKRQFDPIKSKGKVLVDCSECSLPIYKVFKCHFCHGLCHFSCCLRYVKEAELTPLLINKCISCANSDNMCPDEEVILGT